MTFAATTTALEAALKISEAKGDSLMEHLVSALIELTRALQERDAQQTKTLGNIESTVNSLR